MTEYTYRVPGAILTEREHQVPLDHARPDGPTITVFTSGQSSTISSPIVPCPAMKS